MKRQEIHDIAELDKAMLTPTDICEFLGTNAQSIRDQAHNNPAMLGFPVMVVGARTLIPRDGFVRWYTGGNLE